MRKLFIIFLLFSSSVLYAETLHYENFIAKERSNRSRSETYYLGQIKTKKQFEELNSEYNCEYLENYSGFHNVYKLSNENLDLFFSENDVYSLIEIHIKTNKFYLNNTSITAGTSIDNIIHTWKDSFSKYEKDSLYYFAEIEDFTFEFSNVSFLNISLCVENNIIKEIILYYSFTL